MNGLACIKANKVRRMIKKLKIQKVVKLQKVREQGIRFLDESIFWHKSLIPTLHSVDS